MADYRELLVKAHQDSSREFDKAIMTLSGAALGVSIAFIRTVAPNPTLRWSVATAWALFAVSLLLTLISHLTSQGAILHQINVLDGRANEPTTRARALLARLDHAKWTTWLNYGSAGAFVLGVGFLVLFAVYNFKP